MISLSDRLGTLAVAKQRTLIRPTNVTNIVQRAGQAAITDN
jgi:hypothetical protein